MTNAKPLNTVAGWLRTHLGQRVGIAPEKLDGQLPFTSYGIASIEAINLVKDLEKWLGYSLSPTLTWDYPNINELAHFLVDHFITKPTDGAGIVTDIATEDVTIVTEFPADQESIAIVGMGCRYPGAQNPTKLWELVSNGIDAITEIPAERWDVDATYHPDATAPGKSTTRYGGFLEKIEEFDAQFFGISPREAPHIDPRQRLMMEIAWEALEDAGIPPHSLAGSRTGVFIATLTNDYDHILFHDLARVEAYSGAGTANSIVANRLSYFLDLRGPSMAIDTACSGALVAVHLACQSLRQGESTMALVGGVSINLMPKSNVFFSKAGALAANGRCKTFDNSADGIVRSDGAGLIVLKPLSQALVDGDPIYAIIRGSAVNHDGHSNGIMAPNGQAQEAVLREAYDHAGIAPSQVQYVEAHGTGTRVGDPIEVNALGAVLNQGRNPDQPCVLGSIKTNIGHTEPAAGIAGIIKTALALTHRAIPPTVHFEEPNELIPFDKLPFVIHQQVEKWPSPAEPLYAGVSSFGFGGTNAHVVLAEAPVTARPLITGDAAAVRTTANPEAAVGQPTLVPLSGHTATALQEQVQAYQDAIRNGQLSASIRDIGYTAGVRRTHQNHRLAVVAQSKAELVEKLSAVLNDETRPGLVLNTAVTGREQKLAFVFSGQGSHWFTMGCELLETEPVFRKTMAVCDQLLQAHTGWSLLAELGRGESDSRLNETDVTQPAIFAIQVALTALWRSWGIVPDVVVGHSLGEVAAAHTAGILTLEEAIRIVYHRSRLMKTVAGKGATAVVGLDLEQAQLVLTGQEDLLGVAGSNSPTTSVLSGDPDMLDRVLTSLEKRGIFCRKLRGVDIAFHSPQMDPLKAELVQALKGLSPRPATIPIFSTVTGDLLDGTEFDATYWGRNLRDPFLFADVLQKLLKREYDILLEVSPHPVLSSAILQGIQDSTSTAQILPSLRRNEDERATLLATLGTFYTLGYAVNWPMLYSSEAHHVALPSYPWQRRRYWYDQLPSSGATMTHRASQSTDTHPLLGTAFVPAQLSSPRFWEVDLGAYSTAYLSDHRVLGSVMLPGAAYLEMALAAAQQALPGQETRITELTFEQALRLPEDGVRRVQVVLSPHGTQSYAFQVYSRAVNQGQSDGTATHEAETAWVLHAAGSLAALSKASASAEPASVILAGIKARCSEFISAERHYTAMAGRGLQYGPAFQGIQEIWRRDGEVLSALTLRTDLHAEAALYQVHPTLLDASFQAVAATMPARDEDEGPNPIYLPQGVDQIQVYRQPGTKVWCHARLHDGATVGADLLHADITLLDERGAVLVVVAGLRLQRLDAGQHAPSKEPQDWIYTVDWQLQALAESDRQQQAQAGRWLIFADNQGVGSKLASRLETLGESCRLVYPGSCYQELESATKFQLNPTVATEFQQLVTTIVDQDAAALRGVVYLWGLEATNADGTAAEVQNRVQQFSSEAPLHLLRSLTALNTQEMPRLWLVTERAQSVGSSSALDGVAQAPLWGLGRVIALEHPELWGGLVDIDDAASNGSIALLSAELLNATSPEQVGYRNGERYVARLVQSTRGATPVHSLPVRTDGSYLITGGLSGLGLLTARWLVEQGARRLILLGRSSLSPRATWRDLPADHPASERVRAIQELEAMGASVHFAAVDVADEAQLVAYLSQYQQEGYPAIRGVIHSAGIIDDRLLMNMELETMARVLRPKVAGAWALHAATEGMDLDFFVLFSSASALLGQFGQANYAAGNAFMDALAHYRRTQGQPALSINWGPWAEVGMFARLENDGQTQRTGVQPIPPAQGLRVLAHLLEHDSAQAAVIGADWQKMPALPLLAELTLVASSTNTAEEGVIEDDTALLELLLADPAERQAIVEAQLHEMVAQVLRLDAKQLDIWKPLTNLGLDSLMAVELKNRVEVNWGVALPMVDLFTGSVGQLANQVASQIHIDEEVAGLLDEVAGLSLDEVASLLNS